MPQQKNNISGKIKFANSFGVDQTWSSIVTAHLNSSHEGQSKIMQWHRNQITRLYSEQPPWMKSSKCPGIPFFLPRNGTILS